MNDILFFTEDACYTDGNFPLAGECRQYLWCANNRTYIQDCAMGSCFVADACIQDCSLCIP